MSRLSVENTVLASEIIARYPRAKSALIPLLHLAQEQDGYVTQRGDAPHRRARRVTPAEVLRHGVVLRDVQVRAARQVPDQHLRHDVVRVVGRRGADAPRRAAAGHQGGRHDDRRAVLAAPRRVPGRVHRGPVPAGQLSLPLPRDAGPARPADRRPGGGRARRRDPAARHGRHGPPADPRRPGRRRRRPRRRQRRRRSGCRRQPPRRRPSEQPDRHHLPLGARVFYAGDRAERPIVTSRFELRGLVHARALPRHRRLRGTQEGAGQAGPPTCTTTSRTPPCSVAAAPASRPA